MFNTDDKYVWRLRVLKMPQFFNQLNDGDKKKVDDCWNTISKPAGPNGYGQQFRDDIDAVEANLKATQNQRNQASNFSSSFKPSEMRGGFNL